MDLSDLIDRHAAFTPGKTAIRFEVQTAKRNADKSLTFGPWLVAANSTLGDPALCKASGPEPCPKSLYKLLGEDSVHDEDLNLRITLTPTPDNLLPATLRSWQVSYSCVPSE